MEKKIALSYARIYYFLKLHFQIDFEIICYCINVFLNYVFDYFKAVFIIPPFKLVIE